MKNVTCSVKDNHQKEFIKIFNRLSGKYSRWEIWSDFVTLSAIAISNTVDKVNAAEREKSYHTITDKYKPQELDAFASMLAETVNGLEDNQDQDFLGELYMKLALGNDHKGQFFTPYSICTAMAQLTSIDMKNRLETEGWISVNDCACGAGALLIAFANECKRQNVNYQTNVLFVAQDIDFVVGMMCYLQLSLLGCPGYVVIGDTIAHPAISYDKRGLIPKHTRNVWYTPFYFRDVWHWRRTWVSVDLMFQYPPAAIAAKTVPVSVSDKCGKTAPPTEEKSGELVASPQQIKNKSYNETKCGQLTFF